MKVALICPDYLPCPPIRGGAIELLIHRSAPCLVSLGHSVTVFSIQDPLFSDMETVDGVEHIRLPKSGYCECVMEHLKRDTFDLMQVYNKPNWAIRLRKAFPEARIILSLHNLLLGISYGNKTSRQAVDSADRIITVSQFVARDIVSRYPNTSGKVLTLYTGENQHRYIPRYTDEGNMIAEQMKGSLGIPADFQVILYVGRLQPKKGCHFVVKAMRIIKKRYPKTALVIVGSRHFGKTNADEYVTSLQKKAKEISEHIYFTNLLPSDILASYYTMSDIFVCPSQWEEPLARVQYEAMAAGIPIVTTNRGGNSEVVKQGRNGYVVERYNRSMAFADAIMQLLDDEQLRAKIGKANRHLIVKKYNIMNYAKRISKVYKKLAD